MNASVIRQTTVNKSVSMSLDRSFATALMDISSTTTDAAATVKLISISVIQYNTIQYNTIQYSTVQYSTVQYSTVQYSTVQYSTVQYSTVQYSTVQYSTVQYSTVQYSTVQYSTVQYSTVQYSTIQYNTIQYNYAYTDKRAYPFFTFFTGTENLCSFIYPVNLNRYQQNFKLKIRIKAFIRILSLKCC